MRHIQLLQTHHPRNLLRQLPDQIIITRIKNPNLLQQPNLPRQTSPQPIIQKNYLIQCLRHIPQARRNTAMKPIVRQNHHGNRRVPNSIRYFIKESIVVDKNRVEILVEKRIRDLPVKFVEPDVEKLERRKAEDDVGKLTGEPIVAQIDLEEKMHGFEAVRYGAAETVGIDMEDREVAEEAELLRQEPGDIAMIKVYGCDDDQARIGRQNRAENPGVVADVRANPIAS